MKLGIIGLPRSGKSTVFEALTHNILPADHKGETRIGTVRVPDRRVDVLSNMYQPQKTIYAQVEYFLPDVLRQKQDQKIWTQVRDCDALIHVVRNFGGYGFETPAPYQDLKIIDQELMLNDLVVIEKKLESVDHDKHRGKKVDPTELSLLRQCLETLEKETPLRTLPDLASAHLLKGYAFLSAKPMLILFNNEDDDNDLPDNGDSTPPPNTMVIRGKLEQELAQMSDDDAEDFLTEFNITASAMDRVIQRSYELLGLISFFTIGKDEVRAWTIKTNSPAVEAAGVIHTDMKKGFIRAEVVSFDDLISAGSYPEARKQGNVRLEGKTYAVQDGDILEFRFTV
jgi:ribosome-binding ATPase